MVAGSVAVEFMQKAGITGLDHGVCVYVCLKSDVAKTGSAIAVICVYVKEIHSSLQSFLQRDKINLFILEAQNNSFIN